MLEIVRLLTEERLNELGPGTPNLVVQPLLQELEGEWPKKARDRAFAAACLAGLWLYHDFLAESHAVSQELDTIEGSYWHALMHRREPDYGNSKYWFKRCPQHPISDDLCKEAALLTEQAGTPAGCEQLAGQKVWDSLAFVDLCESAARGPDALALLCRRIQLAEWKLLFHYCYERARL
jgi:hypothetical protein